MSRLRRVLFVSYWMRPRKAIGTIRSSHIMRYLPEYGWDVEAVTAQFNGLGPPQTHVSVVQTGYWDIKGGIKRLAGIGQRSASEALKAGEARYGSQPRPRGRALRLASDLVTYPDDYVGWLPFATGAIHRLAQSGRYDALLTSSPPVTTNLIAAMARGKLPWIADLRDLWAEDDSSVRSFMRTALDEKLERATLSRARALVASSERSAARFHVRYPCKPCYAISTGYDAEDWIGIPFAAEPRCTLLYAGNFYRGRRDPRLLFSALRALFDRGQASQTQVCVDLYCEPEPWLLRCIAEYQLEDTVRVRGSAERAAVLAAERRADRLLVFSWDGATAEGVVPGKLFEYFGARRRILAVGGTPASTVDDLLRSTGSGVRCLTEEEVQREVVDALREHKNGARVLPQDATSAYTAEACAREFARILDSVVGAR